jgi:hypothetical protein
MIWRPMVALSVLMLAGCGDSGPDSSVQVGRYQYLPQAEGRITYGNERMFDTATGTIWSRINGHWQDMEGHEFRPGNTTASK